MTKEIKTVATIGKAQKEVQLGGEIRVVQPDNSPEAFISQALATGAPVETLERLLAMRTQLKEERAREAFYDALASFQSECPTIEKTRGVPTKSGEIAYKYAPIDTIIKGVKGLLQKHGFSYIIKTSIEGENVKSVCEVHHRDGHSENSEMEVPTGAGTQIMSKSQVVAAASTFSKRYAFLNAFGIMTGDEDNEEALQDPKEFQADAIKEAKGRLAKAKNVKELLSAWANLPAASKKEPKIVELKDEIKAKLETTKQRNEDLEGPRGEMTEKEKKEIIEKEKKQ